jgi:hypothetical protein
MRAARFTRRARRAGPLACLLALALAGASACGAAKGPSLTGARAVPRGYAVYRAAGYSFAYPAGWRSSKYQSDPTQGGVSVAPPGPTPIDDAYPRIDTERSAARASFPPPQDFNSFIANLRDETSVKLPSGRFLAQQVAVSTVTVPGARAARLVNVLDYGQLHELDLIALTSNGVVELSVRWYPANEQLNPRTVVDSFRLGA